MNSIKINDKLAIRKLKDTWLIVTLDNTLHRIEDPVGVFVLDLITERGDSVTDEAVWDKVAEKFDVSKDPEGYKRIVFSFLNDLANKGIIDFVSSGGHS